MRLLLFASALFTVSTAYKMVLIVPSLPPSQIVFNSRVAGALARAGHDVTVALMHAFDGVDLKSVKIPENVKVYHVNASTGEDLKELEKGQGDLVFQDLSFFDPKMRKWTGHLMSVFTKSCRKTLQNKEFMAWLQKSKFDLAFVHMYHICPVGLAHAANIPWIWLNSGPVMDYISYAIGTPLPPSYVPPMLMISSDRMNLYERTKSFVGHFLMKLIWPRMVAIPETQIFREEWDPNFPDLLALAENTSLVMTNSHPFYELARPTLAKVVQIGGIGAQLKDAKPLPEELEKFIGEGDGALVLTFGSVAPIHQAPESWKTAILKAFGRLPQYRFVMRYMGDDLDGRLPPNLKIMKWLPQSDLLQHPRVRGFISHGGYNGFQETIVAGKPIIMIPLAADQPKNAKQAEHLGMAIVVSKGEVTEEKLYSAIYEIVTNPSYAAAAKRLSAMVQKQPVPAEQLLVKWAELLAEFKHLDNLRPAGQRLNFFQYHSLDVIGLLLAAVFLSLFLIFALLKCVIRRLFCSKKFVPPQEEQKKKHQ